MTADKALRPRDAATLIILRNDGPQPRIMMGKRHAGHRFMPNKYVFPGGRVDLADCRVKPARGLRPEVEQKLLSRMRGQPSRNRAQGLAMAAIRETFEETGLVVGVRNDAPPRTRSQPWRNFLDTGYAPDLGEMHFFARAITPPGRPRRFDTRFLVANASIVANLNTPVETASDELLERHWMTFEDTRSLDLPWITGQILKRLQDRLDRAGNFKPASSVTFQYMRGKTWQYEEL